MDWPGTLTVFSIAFIFPWHGNSKNLWIIRRLLAVAECLPQELQRREGKMHDCTTSSSSTGSLTVLYLH